MKVEVRNAGPHDARDVMVVLNEANHLPIAASGKGWKCKGALCTLPLLRAGQERDAHRADRRAAAGTKATVSARVRADRVREAVVKDNGAKVTLP